MWHRGGPKGAWLPHYQRISLRHGMDDTTTLCTLAHEVAHVVHDHPADTTRRQEIRADMWAARQLIDATRVIPAARMYPHSSAMVAHELGVTVHLLQVWCSIISAKISTTLLPDPPGAPPRGGPVAPKTKRGPSTHRRRNQGVKGRERLTSRTDQTR